MRVSKANATVSFFCSQEIAGIAPESQKRKKNTEALSLKLFISLFMLERKLRHPSRGFLIVSNGLRI